MAFGIGVLGEIALDGPAPGLNVPLMTGVVLGLAWIVRRPGRAPDPLDAWLPLTAMVLATFVAIRADPFVAMLDLVGAAAFTGASVVAFSGLAVTRRSLSAILAMGVWVVESTLAGTAQLLRAARPRPGETMPERPPWMGSVLRGLVLAIPLVMIFAGLFASADPIFRRGMDGLLGFRIDLGDLPGRLIFVASVAWPAGGLLAISTRGFASPGHWGPPRRSSSSSPSI